MRRVAVVLMLLSSCGRRSVEDVPASGQPRGETKPDAVYAPDAGSPATPSNAVDASADAPAAATDAAQGAEGAPPDAAAKDPPGFRSFDDPMAKLPPANPRAHFESDGEPCPVDMVHVSGQRCTVPIQECLEWVDDPGKPQRACGKFRSPSECKGARHGMRFCIDRVEYTPAGWARPLVHVSWNEASRICHREGKRLCTESEWEFACEGPDALPYPYGYERDGRRCNHDLDELFSLRGKLVDRRLGPRDTPKCESPFGVLNLVGNVDEWTTRPENQPPKRSILRGGWWLKGRNRCRASTSSHSEIYAGPQTGFRCCMAARKVK